MISFENLDLECGSTGWNNWLQPWILPPPKCWSAHGDDVHMDIDRHPCETGILNQPPHVDCKDTLYRAVKQEKPGPIAQQNGLPINHQANISPMNIDESSRGPGWLLFRQWWVFPMCILSMAFPMLLKELGGRFCTRVPYRIPEGNSCSLSTGEVDPIFYSHIHWLSWMNHDIPSSFPPS